MDNLSINQVITVKISVDDRLYTFVVDNIPANNKHIDIHFALPNIINTISQESNVSQESKYEEKQMINRVLDNRVLDNRVLDNIARINEFINIFVNSSNTSGNTSGNTSSNNSSNTSGNILHTSTLQHTSTLPYLSTHIIIPPYNENEPQINIRQLFGNASDAFINNTELLNDLNMYIETCEGVNRWFLSSIYYYTSVPPIIIRSRELFRLYLLKFIKKLSSSDFIDLMNEFNKRFDINISYRQNREGLCELLPAFREGMLKDVINITNVLNCSCERCLL